MFLDESRAPLPSRPPDSLPYCECHVLAMDQGRKKGISESILSLSLSLPLALSLSRKPALIRFLQGAWGGQGNRAAACSCNVNSRGLELQQPLLYWKKALIVFSKRDSPSNLD